MRRIGRPFEFRIARYADGEVSDLGPAPDGFGGCWSFEDRVVGMFPGTGSGGGEVSVRELVNGETTWREVGSYGSADLPASGQDIVYDSGSGLRMMVPIEAPSARWPDGQDTILYDVGLDGRNERSLVDRIPYQPYVGMELESFSSIDDLHATRDEGGFTHLAYVRAGLDFSSDLVEPKPGLAGGYGVRYAVRTDAGWVVKDILWQRGEFDGGNLVIQDILAWNGEVHILVSTTESQFTLGTVGSPETYGGLYDLHASGCAAR